MKNNNYKIIRIISVVIIALLLAGSSISSFLHFKEKRDALLHQGINENKEESDYEPLPVPEETDIAEDITSPTDIPLPSGLTSPSDVEPQPVETSPSRPLEEKMTIKYVKILDVTNVRKEDKADAEKVAVLNKGTEVEYVSESKTRYQVKYAGNKTGWVVKSCCEILEKEVIIKHVPTYVSGAPIDLKGTAEGDELAKILKNQSTMGASIAIIQNGQVAYHYEYGYANKENKKYVTEDTKFRIASVTKVFTSMMAMKQVDDGILDLDKDISDYLGFKVRNPSFTKDPITTRMLLTHTGGLVDRDKMYINDLRATLSDKSHFNSQPGKSFLYSNLGMGVAGSVMEKTSHQVISEYARDNFFKPMNIDASFDAQYLSDKSLIADCYLGSKIDRSSKYLARPQATGKPGATYHLTAGGLLISAEDLASVFTILLNNGQYNGQQYLSQKAVDEMLSEQFKPKGNNFIQCIGLRQRDQLLDNHDMYFHNGIAYGIYSLMAIDTNEKSGVVVITSGANGTRNENTIFAVCDDVLNYCYSDIL